MSTVHAKTPVTIASRSTVRTRRKKPAPITCHGCGGGRGECRCLSDWRLRRQALEAIERLLIQGEDPERTIRARRAHRHLARERMRGILERRDQQEREAAMFRKFAQAHIASQSKRRFSARRDIYMLSNMLGVYAGVGSTSTTSVEMAAEFWARPAGYVKVLRDRLLRSMQPRPVTPIRKRVLALAGRYSWAGTPSKAVA